MYNTFANNMSMANANSLNFTPNPLMNNMQQDTSSAYSQQFFGGGAQQSVQPLQYHLYGSFGPRREDLAPYQRAAQDLFIPDNLREELQKKSHAATQTLQSGIGLLKVGAYHTFVPLEDAFDKSSTTFGYNTSLYKVTSSKDGNLYALRRIEGFLLHDETVVFAWRRWRNVRNPNIVAAVDVFTGGAEFQDGTSSLCVITDYHPLSTTLARKHLSVKRYHGSKQVQLPDTNTLWTYVVQIANALQAIHAANLAARMLDPSKILLTDEKHVRLNVCGILDVTDRDIKSSKPDLQREDLNKFGHLISTLATGPQASKSDDLSAIYSEITKRHGDMLANRVLWLLHPQVENYTIDYFLQSIQPQVMRVLNAAMSANDELGSVLCRELENSRLVRLMTKINFVTERPEQAENTKWSEVGEWYPIKLFRDFVFHQRHQDGAPSLDLAHVMASLNKLDAGNDENIELTDEINDTNIVVSYRDLKRLVTSAFDDLKQQERRRNTTGY
jgi:PAB-dependent poly(A)-specific ribonuclease subunit 3